MTWADGAAVGMDLYYDPVVDEHIASPAGLVAPAWYLAPQRREVAEAGWNLAALFSGVHGDGPIVGLDDPELGVFILQLAGEFADPATKARVWAAADEHIEPTWNREAGEFTFGFGLGEDHPRGQLNARAMAGWVCDAGAWSDVFNAPNLTKFDLPEVVGVDFPRVALSEASWNGGRLALAAHPQNAAVAGEKTAVRVRGASTDLEWRVERPDGEIVRPTSDAGDLVIELVADDQRWVLASD